VAWNSNPFFVLLIHGKSVKFGDGPLLSNIKAFAALTPTNATWL